MKRPSRRERIAAQRADLKLTGALEALVSGSWRALGVDILHVAKISPISFDLSPTDRNWLYMFNGVAREPFGRRK